MDSRPFLGDYFGRTGNNFYRACAIFPVLHEMASEKPSVFVVAWYRLGSRRNGNSSRSMKGEGVGDSSFKKRVTGLRDSHGLVLAF